MRQDKEKKAKDKINQRRKLLLGLSSTTVVAAWHKPIVKAIVVPAHAQMSVIPDPTPAELCPMIAVGNVVTGPVSGSPTPAVCSLTFDVLSGTSGTPLTITAITTNTLPTTSTVTIDALGEATDIMGPRVVWRGEAAGAPFCSPFTPVEEVTFTVTASCVASDGGTFSQDFLLSDMLPTT